MTKQIDERTMYIDSEEDHVKNSIKEIRSSVSYTLNPTTEDLVLNAPLDYEIKNISGEDCFVYGYPDKWELDYMQGNGELEDQLIGSGMKENCGIVCCLNILYMAGKLDDISQKEWGYHDINEYNINQLAKLANQTDDIGTTNPDNQVNILAIYGIQAETKILYSSEYLANCIKQGRAIIISVNSL